MTRFQALYVKYLRVKLDGSWRWVAAKYNQRYVEKLPFSLGMTYSGNQIQGINLCEEAMKFLNEKINQGWN